MTKQELAGMEEEQSASELEVMGDSMEKRALVGEKIMTAEESDIVRGLFEKWGVNLENIKIKGDLNAQANRVLEAFQGWDIVLSDLVARCVMRLMNLRGEKFSNEDGLKNKNHLESYVFYYLRFSLAESGFDFPVNAKLFNEKQVPEVVKSAFVNTKLDLQKVGYDVEKVMSTLNRLMFYCGPRREDYEARIDLSEPKVSLHSLQNRILRGYEVANRGAEITVDLSEYGKEEKRKLIRGLIVGGLGAVLDELEESYKLISKHQ